LENAKTWRDTRSHRVHSSFSARRIRLRPLERGAGLVLFTRSVTLLGHGPTLPPAWALAVDAGRNLAQAHCPGGSRHVPALVVHKSGSRVRTRLCKPISVGYPNRSLLQGEALPNDTSRIRRLASNPSVGSPGLHDLIRQVNSAGLHLIAIAVRPFAPSQNALRRRREPRGKLGSREHAAAALPPDTLQALRLSVAA